MCKLKAKIVPGIISSERIAYIKTLTGMEAEVIIPAKQSDATHVFAAEIGRDNNNVLIELPRETTAGQWRLWVAKDLVEA